MMCLTADQEKAVIFPSLLKCHQKKYFCLTFPVSKSAKKKSALRLFSLLHSKAETTHYSFSKKSFGQMASPF